MRATSAGRTGWLAKGPLDTGKYGQAATKNVASCQSTATAVCSFNSSNVLPLAAFHFTQPLAERPISAMAAGLGLGKRWLRVKTHVGCALNGGYVFNAAFGALKHHKPLGCVP